MQMVQIPLQDKNCRYLIDMLFTVFPSDSALNQSSLCLYSSKSLIPHDDFKSCPPVKHVLKFQRLFCPLTDIIVHMFRKTKHDLLHTIFTDQFLDTGTGPSQFVFSLTADRFNCLGCKSERSLIATPTVFVP